MRRKIKMGPLLGYSLIVGALVIAAIYSDPTPHRGGQAPSVAVPVPTEPPWDVDKTDSRSIPPTPPPSPSESHTAPPPSGSVGPPLSKDESRKVRQGKRKLKRLLRKHRRRVADKGSPAPSVSPLPSSMPAPKPHGLKGRIEDAVPGSGHIPDVLWPFRTFLASVATEPLLFAATDGEVLYSATVADDMAVNVEIDLPAPPEVETVITTTPVDPVTEQPLDDSETVVIRDQGDVSEAAIDAVVNAVREAVEQPEAYGARPPLLRADVAESSPTEAPSPVAE